MKGIDSPLVSICCITFNHASFIRQCLDGFIMQETDFAFEVLIHDDASTDGTADIIREYEVKYPHIFKPIYQTENQWVKGKRGSAVFNFPRAKGEYIALCEGDDYWTDPLKLQKQVDFLEENKDCSLCFHAVRTSFINTNKKEVIVGPSISGNHIFSSKEMIKNGFVRIVSAVFKADISRNLPDWYFTMPHGDYPLQLICADKGRVGYLGNQVMSVYRRGVEGAWSGLQHSEDNEKRKQWYKKRLQDHILILETFNKETNFKYNVELRSRIKKTKLDYINNTLLLNNKRDRVKLINKNILKLLKVTDKTIIVIWLKFILGDTGFERLKKLRP